MCRSHPAWHCRVPCPRLRGHVFEQWSAVREEGRACPSRLRGDALSGLCGRDPGHARTPHPRPFSRREKGGRHEVHVVENINLLPSVNSPEFGSSPGGTAGCHAPRLRGHVFVTAQAPLHAACPSRLRGSGHGTPGRCQWPGNGIPGRADTADEARQWHPKNRDGHRCTSMHPVRTSLGAQSSRPSPRSGASQRRPVMSAGFRILRRAAAEPGCLLPAGKSRRAVAPEAAGGGCPGSSGRLVSSTEDRHSGSGGRGRCRPLPASGPCARTARASPSGCVCRSTPCTCSGSGECGPGRPWE